VTNSALPPLLIVGAGGCGRETAEAVRAVNDRRATWELLGFLDDGPAVQGTAVDGVPVVGPVDAIGDHPDASLIVTIGNPDNFTTRRTIVSRLGLPPDRYATIVHPAASIPRSTHVGPGTVILAGSIATTAVTIGAHVVVMPAVVFTHDDVVNDYATFGTGAHLAGAVNIGEGAYIGAGVLIREKRTIGPWALVGMGSAVTRDVPAGEVWAGTPARFFRQVPLPDDLRNAVDTVSSAATDSATT
jgi:sugar O-acyltransferase (sialic acid O-acetyltransferase NeuD family)